MTLKGCLLIIDPVFSMYIVFQRVEREIQEKLEAKEESAVELQETYVSLQQEVEIKTKKLKKVRQDFIV